MLDANVTRTALPLLLAIVACGGSTPAEPAVTPEPEAQPGPELTENPSYDLHEWGVVTLGAGAFEVAAGPGRPPPAMDIVVEKPVLYVHPEDPSAAFDLSVAVTLPDGLRVAEHFPPTQASPLSWTARVEGRCRGAYPTDVDLGCPGGYCELRELASYETPDAACLSVNGVRAPLLFYRLFSPAGDDGLPSRSRPAMPLAVSVEADGWVIENRALGAPLGPLWRVRSQGGVTRVSSIAMPARGERATLGPPTGPVAAAHADMLRVLGERGLTEAERAVFDRTWSPALFGGLVAAAERVVEELPVAEEDMPEETTEALLYWLPDVNIDALARIDATPAPRHLRRAFLVRHIVQRSR